MKNKKNGFLVIGLVLGILGISGVALATQYQKFMATPAILSNGAAYQGALRVSATYRDPTITTSTDPFSGKTNKYAESRIVRVTAASGPVYVLWGTSSIGSVTTSNGYLILTNTSTDFAVDPNKAYLRVIGESASSDVQVIEFE